MLLGGSLRLDRDEEGFLMIRLDRTLACLCVFLSRAQQSKAPRHIVKTGGTASAARFNDNGWI